MSKVFIFIPTINESGNIEILINKIFSIDADYNIIIVDDGSTDGTREKILDLEKKYTNLHHIFRNEKGRGTAARDAFIEILKHDPEFVMEMDADLSHNPDDIPRLLDEIKECDMVIGSRLHKDSNQSDRHFVRTIITHLANFYIKIILNCPVKDYTSGYRCYRAECLKNIPLEKLISKNPSVLEELLYIFTKKNFRIKEIPIVFYERKYGVTKLRFKDLLNILITIIKIKLHWDKILR